MAERVVPFLVPPGAAAARDERLYALVERMWLSFEQLTDEVAELRRSAARASVPARVARLRVVGD